MSARRRPPFSAVGQVLLATLLFCFIFVVLFLGIVKAGRLYGAKTRTTRAADLTIVSGGAVYANGLHWVRCANVLLTGAIVVDVVKMAVAAVSAGGLSLGSGSIPAALAADRTNLRQPLQKALDYVFGVEQSTGLYPLWIALETDQVARANGLKPSEGKWGPSPLPPVILYNLKTTPGMGSLVPGMSLRFRTGEDLLKEWDDVPEEEPRYVTRDRRSGISVTLRADQVEPCVNPRHSGQMCVKSGVPFLSGQYCRELGSQNPSSVSGATIRNRLGRAKWALKVLKPLLKNLKLDITHRAHPPCHTLTLIGPRKDSGLLIHQTSQMSLEGGGLAAWDLNAPKFRCRLTPVGYESLPILRSISAHLPAGMGDILKFPSGLSTGGPL